MTYAITPVYLVCTAFAKLSHLTCFKALSLQRTYKRVVWCIMGAISLHATTLLFMFVLTCRPMEKSRDTAAAPDGAGPTCLDRRALYLAFAVGNVLGDLSCVVVLVRIVLTAQMEWSKKVAASAVFVGASMLVLLLSPLSLWLLSASANPC